MGELQCTSLCKILKRPSKIFRKGGRYHLKLGYWKILEIVLSVLWTLGVFAHILRHTLWWDYVFFFQFLISFCFSFVISPGRDILHIPGLIQSTSASWDKSNGQWSICFSSSDFCWSLICVCVISPQRSFQFAPKEVFTHIWLDTQYVSGSWDKSNGQWSSGR